MYIYNNNNNMGTNNITPPSLSNHTPKYTQPKIYIINTYIPPTPTYTTHLPTHLPIHLPTYTHPPNYIFIYTYISIIYI